MCVRPIRMRAADESVVAMRQLHGEVVAYAVRRRRIRLAGLEADAQMVADDIALSLTAPGDGGVLALGEQELLIRDKWVTAISRDPLAAVCLFGFRRAGH